MAQPEEERHELVMVVERDVHEGCAARTEELLRLEDRDGVAAVAEGDVAAREGPEVRAEHRMDARDAQARASHRPERFLDRSLEAGDVEHERLRLHLGDRPEGAGRDGHRDGHGDDVGFADRTPQIRFERESLDGARGVVDDDLEPPRVEVAAQPPAHLSRAADHEDPLVARRRRPDGFLAANRLVDQEAREAFREGRTDVAGRALRQEAGVHEVLGFLVPDRLLQELLFHADLHRQMETLRHEADDLPVDIRNFLAQPGNFRFAQMNPPTSMRSRTVIAAAFSTTGTARGSWRPVTTTFVGCIVSRSTDRCGLAIDAVGLTTTRNVTGMPSVIPPRIPPAWFVAVTTRPDSTTNGSLCSLPRIAAARNPAPNSTPLTAGIENIRCARPDSTESKKGSPTPAGRPVTAASMTPPTLSRSFRAASISAIMRSAASRSAHRTGVRSTFASISAGVTARATTRPTCAACA